MRSEVKAFETWWPGTELNRRRQPFQGCALPPELPGHAGKTAWLPESCAPGTAPTSSAGPQLRAVKTPQTCATAGIITTQYQSLNGSRARAASPHRIPRPLKGDTRANTVGYAIPGKEKPANKKCGGGGGSRTRVRKCHWSRAYMLIHVHAPGITLGRSRPALRTDKKRLPLA